MPVAERTVARGAAPGGAESAPVQATLRVPEQVWARLRAALLAVRDERLGYLIARCSRFVDPWGVAHVDWLATKAIVVPDAALSVQTGVRVAVDPTLCRAVLRACYEAGTGLVDVHTHPFSREHVAFSGHDVANMRVTHAEFAAEVPQDPPALACSLVLGREAVAGAWLDPAAARLRHLDRLQVLGDRLTEVPLCP